MTGLRRSQHAQPAGGEAVQGLSDDVHLVARHAAQGEHGLGRALDRRKPSVRLTPGLRHRQPDGLERPHPFRSRLGRGRQRPQGGVHRVCRLHGAGATSRVEDCLQGRGEGVIAGRAFCTGSPKRGHGHAIGRDRAGLVDAHQGGAAQRLDPRGPPHQHPVTGQAPGAQGQEDRQDDGKLLGDQGDRHGDPGKRALDPQAAKKPVGQDHEPGEAERQGPDPDDDPAGRPLQRRAAFVDQRQGGADPPQRGPRAGGLDPERPLAGDDERSGEDAVGQLSVPGGRGAAAGDGDGFAGQGGFVDPEDVGAEQNAVRRRALALGQQDEIAPHQVTGWDGDDLAVAHHPRGGVREIAQRLERRLAPRLLGDDEPDRDQARNRQQQAFGAIADRQVQGGSDPQEDEHGLTQGRDQDRAERPGAILREQVGTVRGETPGGLGGAEAVERLFEGHGGSVASRVRRQSGDGQAGRLDAGQAAAGGVRLRRRSNASRRIGRWPRWMRVRASPSLE